MSTTQKTSRHVALVSDAWLPQTNGVVRTLQTTISILERRGHKVTVISPLDFKTVPCPTYPEISLSVFPKRKLFKWLDALNPDCVHIATEGPLGLAARRYCTKQELPFTTAFHTRFAEYISARTRLPESWSYAFLRWFHNGGEASMVPSQSMIDTLKEKKFKNPVLWTRGVRLDVFRPADKKPDVFLGLKAPVAICTGRIATEKNLKAFLDMPWQGSKVIIGDGPLLKTYKTRYPDVIFKGYLNDNEMVRHLQAADVFVFPSRTETFGNVVTEALACGLPVACYPETGPMDILEKSRQIGYSVNDVGAIDTNLENAALSALGGKPEICRKLAESFSWEEVTDQFFNHLALINKHKNAA